MAKIIIIENSNDCPCHSGIFCCQQKRIIQYICCEEDGSFPDWCPLKDFDNKKVE